MYAKKKRADFWETLLANNSAHTLRVKYPISLERSEIFCSSKVFWGLRDAMFFVLGRSLFGARKWTPKMQMLK